MVRRLVCQLSISSYCVVVSPREGGGRPPPIATVEITNTWALQSVQLAIGPGRSVFALRLVRAALG